MTCDAQKLVVSDTGWHRRPNDIRSSRPYAVQMHNTSERNRWSHEGPTAMHHPVRQERRDKSETFRASPVRTSTTGRSPISR